MSVKHIDYDYIAATYDRRFQGSSASRIGEKLIALAGEIGARHILEAGCGTGHWLAMFTGARCFGLDLSIAMLRKAQERVGPERLIQASADQLPFCSGSFDLIYCVNALHHFTHPRDFIAQSRQMLAPGGSLVIVGMDAHNRRNRWYVYDYFPETRSLDLSRYPSIGQILDWASAAGFTQGRWEVAEHIFHRLLNEEVLKDPFLEKTGTSQLALLSPEAFAAGLSNIQSAVDEARSTGKSIQFPVDIELFMLVCRIPGGTGK